MSRPKTDINPIPGERLKTIIEEQGITQSDLSRKIYLSQQTISRMLKGIASVTDQTAARVIALYPQYRKAWLMGYDDLKTGADSLSAAFRQSQDTNGLLMQGLISFATLSGYAITSPIDQCSDSDSIPVEAAIQWAKEGYTISRKGKSAKLTLDEMTALQTEIRDFVEFKLQKIIAIQT